MFDLRFLIYSLPLIFILIQGSLSLSKLRLPFKLIFILVAITFVGEIYGKIMALQLNFAGPYYHLHVILEHIFISIIYYCMFVEYRWMKLWTCFSIISLVIFSLLNTSFLQSIKIIPTNAILISGMLLQFTVIFTFVELLREDSTSSLLKQGKFWFNIGTMIFFGIAFFIFGYHNMFSRKKNVPQLMYDILYAANIIMYLFYSLSLYMEARSSNANKLLSASPQSQEKP